MEELGLVHGNIVLDLRARFPSIDGAGAVPHADFVIAVNGREAFLRLHEPDAIEFLESQTCYFTLTASTQAAEHGSGLELIAEIRTGSSPLPADQLEPEIDDRFLIFTLVKDGQIATAIYVEMEMVRYNDDDGLSEKSCPICLDDFNLGMKLAKTPCAHVFHTHCIGWWLLHRLLCPLCRSHVTVGSNQIQTF